MNNVDPCRFLIFLFPFSSSSFFPVFFFFLLLLFFFFFFFLFFFCLFLFFFWFFLLCFLFIFLFFLLFCFFLFLSYLVFFLLPPLLFSSPSSSSFLLSFFSFFLFWSWLTCSHVHVFEITLFLVFFLIVSTAVTCVWRITCWNQRHYWCHWWKSVICNSLLFCSVQSHRSWRFPHWKHFYLRNIHTSMCFMTQQCCIMITVKYLYKVSLGGGGEWVWTLSWQKY